MQVLKYLNSIPINSIRYADDTVVVAATPENFQILINRIVECSEEYGLSLNISKTKIMVTHMEFSHIGESNYCTRT